MVQTRRDTGFRILPDQLGHHSKGPGAVSSERTPYEDLSAEFRQTGPSASRGHRTRRFGAGLGILLAEMME